MRAVVELKNEKGQSLSRTEREFESMEDALQEVAAGLVGNAQAVRALVFEDLRDNEIIPIHHDPRWFTLRVDAQRNPETKEVEFIGQSWPEQADVQ